MIHNFMRRVIKPSRHDPGPGPAGELGVLFDQSPIAMVFRDRQLRARRSNAAFRRLTGLPDDAIIGRRPVAVDLCDQLLQGEDACQDPRTGSGILRLRRVAVRDAATRAKIVYKVGDLITAPVTRPLVMALLRSWP